MTPPKRWPTNAEDARLEAIAQANRIDRLAEPILNGETMTTTEVIQRAGQICRAAQKVTGVLTAVGPKAES